MRFKNKGLIVSLLLVIAALVTSLLATSCSDRPVSSRSASSSTEPEVPRTLQPLPSRPLSEKMKALRANAMRQASELRELPWKAEVGMTELSGWEYGSRASEMARSLGGEELKSLSRLAIAGGVLPEGTDLASLAASFTAVSAGAVYSPLDKQILMMDRQGGDSLLTHEFVHALQDQHFDLLKLLIVRPFDFDRTEAAFALIEGDAMNVQRRAEAGEAYSRRSLDEITRQETARFSEYRKDFGSLFPALLTETFIFRYRDGARFVETVRRRDGQHGVDNLYKRLPATSEQILHPEKYFSGEASRAVAVGESSFTQAGWSLATSTSMGEIGLRGVLLAGVSEKEAVRASGGWGGDRAFLFERDGGAKIFVWKSVWDTRADAEEFFANYNVLQQGRKNVRLVGSSEDGESKQTTWREGGMTTVVFMAGDSVIIVRGNEGDINVALGWVKG
jgi:hypothetical protein